MFSVNSFDRFLSSNQSMRAYKACRVKHGSTNGSLLVNHSCNGEE